MAAHAADGGRQINVASAAHAQVLRKRCPPDSRADEHAALFGEEGRVALHRKKGLPESTMPALAVWASSDKGIEQEEGSPLETVLHKISCNPGRMRYVFYAHIDNHEQARGINGPLFTRKVCGGANMNGALLNPDDFHGRNPLAQKPRKIPWQTLAVGEHLEEAWAGHPLGLNVRVPTPVQKGDAYRSGTHYKSKFDPTIAPTGGTIGLAGCSIPGVTNITGSEVKNVLPTKAVGVIGKKLGSYKADAKQFLIGHEKHPPLAFPARFQYPDQTAGENRNTIRPPTHGEIMRREAQAKLYKPPNFIVKNQIDCIVEGTRKKDPARMISMGSSDAKESGMDGAWGSGDAGSPSGQRSKKMQRRQATILEKQLEAARRDDFEALLSGQNPHGLARMQRLATVVKLRESLPRPAPTPERATASRKSPLSGKRVQTASFQASDRPYSTQSSIYSDMTAMSGSTVYLHDDKLVKKLPFDMRRQLIRSMKKKWDEVNKEYQLLTLSLFNLDTVNKVTKKEACEETMARLEKEIIRLSKGHVYVEADVESLRPGTTMQ